MAVAQLVSHFETIHHESSVKSIHSSFRSHSSSSRVRLSLQTIFSHNPLHRPSKGASAMSSTAASSLRSSPSSTFSNFGGRACMPRVGLDHTISPTLTSSSASGSTNYIRRQPSAIDLALEEERSADPVELLGLGLLEPRPRANTFSAGASSLQCSMMEFISETTQAPVMLEGIFEVMERGLA